MRTTRILLLACTTLCCAIATIAYAQEIFPVTINLHGYTGHLFIANHEMGNGQDDVLHVRLKEGVNVMETGDFECSQDSLFCSSARIIVNAHGAITNVWPQDVASIPRDGRTLDLRTSTITIDPGLYTGHYFLSTVIDIHHWLRGEQRMTLINGLAYSIDNGAHAGSTFTEAPDGSMFFSKFRFRVQGDGTIQPQEEMLSPASGAMGKLTFNTSMIRITDSMINGHRALRLSDDPDAVITAPGDQVMIRGLLAWLQYDGQEAQYFIP